MDEKQTRQSAKPVTSRQLLRTRDVLAMLPILRPTLYKMVEAGDFPKPVKFGSCTCWVEAEVQAWLQRRLGDR